MIFLIHDNYVIIICLKKLADPFCHLTEEESKSTSLGACASKLDAHRWQCFVVPRALD